MQFGLTMVSDGVEFDDERKVVEILTNTNKVEFDSVSGTAPVSGTDGFFSSLSPLNVLEFFYTCKYNVNPSL